MIHIQIEGFDIRGKLSKEGSERVWEAVICQTNEKVALKVVRKDTIDRDAVIRRFRREVDCLKRLNGHPHIVNMLDVQFDKIVTTPSDDRFEVAVITLEFAENGDLFDLVKNNGPLSEKLARTYFHQLVRAVEACHDAGIFHRDLKPDNLLLNRKFQLKLADFDYSWNRNFEMNEEKKNDEELARMCGTIQYMAPESLLDRTLDFEKADVWSAGVILFAMLTRHLPFKAPRRGDYYFNRLLRGQRDDFWRDHLKQGPQLSSETKSFIDRFFCIDVQSRPCFEEIKKESWFQDGNLYSDNELENVMSHMRITSNSDIIIGESKFRL